MTRLLFLSLLFLASCASPPHRFASVLSTDQTAEVLALGDRPRVLIESSGPGLLLVHLSGPMEEVPPITLRPGVTTMRTLIGPVRMQLTTSSEEGCGYSLTVHGCDGLRIDALVEPQE